MLSERVSKKDKVSLQQILIRVLLLKYRYLGSFPPDYAATFDNDTFGIINTQPSNMQGEHWIMNAKYRHEINSADSLGRKKYRFLKQQHKQMMPAHLHYHPSVCGFCIIYAAFHPFKFCLKEYIGVQDFHVLCFISNKM